MGRVSHFRADQQGQHSARLQLLEVNSGVERTLVAALVEAFIWRPDGRAIRYVEHGKKHTVREVALDRSATSRIRVLESAVSGISGIQLYSYTAALVGSAENGVFLVPLPKGAVTLITKVPGRDRASALRDGRVAVPISKRSALIVGVPGGATKEVKLSFGMSSYLANALPDGGLVVSGPLEEDRFAIYAVPAANEARVLFAAPPGTKIDWFEVARDGQYLAVTLSETKRLE